MNPNTPIRIYEITAGTLAIEKVNVAPLSDEETEILNKLLQIKFEERTPEAVKSVLSSEELKVLDELVRKHLVTLYYGGKYSEKGVYTIPNLVFRQISAKQPSSKTDTTNKGNRNEEESVSDEEDLIKKFNKEGYLVLQSEKEAMDLSKVLSEKFDKNKITGIRGFDKKYYLVKNSYVLKYQSRIKSILKSGPKSAEKIASELGIQPEAAIAILTVLREEGEIIEKRKGLFCKVD
ncbi:MAG: hypothetical protein NZ903_01225 [Candidatus Micrarchaeota archaeon]|nr:hypothetical protein [Candidatus Micrarchaeota archaeon]